MRVYTTVLFYSVLALTFAVSCQGRSDCTASISERLLGVEHPSADHSYKKDKHEQWKKGLVCVTKVVDGDTFWVDNGTEKIKVRFIGIDAPETRNSRWKKKGYFAQEAKKYVHDLTENKWMKLETDVQLHDRYRRLLAYVYFEDGTFLNADLVAKGYAVVDTYPPNVKYVDRFVELQREAREQGLGLWKETLEQE